MGNNRSEYYRKDRQKSSTFLICIVKNPKKHHIKTRYSEILSFSVTLSSDIACDGVTVNSRCQQSARSIRNGRAMKKLLISTVYQGNYFL